MRRFHRSQALVEFSLIVTLLLVLILGVIDISWLFTTRTQDYQAVRAAARYAATHPDAWDWHNPAVAHTIESTLQSDLNTVNLPNQDIVSDGPGIAIQYFVISNGNLILCGHYSAAAHAFIPAPNYTQASCLLPGTMIQVTATYTYSFLSPAIIVSDPGPGVNISAVALALEES